MLRARYLKSAIWIFIFLLIFLAPSILRAQIPTEAEVHNRLGNEYCDRGEFNKGVKEYEEAIRIYPKYIDAYYNLGVTYYHDLKDYQKAAHYFQKFLELESGTSDAQQVQNWVADIQKQLGITPAPVTPEKRVEVAKVETAKEVKEPEPSKLPPQPQAKAEQTKEDIYKKALEFKERGNLYSKEGRYQMAVREYLKAIELRPDYTDALYNLAKTYDFDLQDDENAIKYYEEFLKYEKSDTYDAKEVKRWILKARQDLAAKKEAKPEKKLVKLEQPPPLTSKPMTPPPGARYEDRPFTKGLLEQPAQVASLTPAETPRAEPPTQPPVSRAPAPPPLAPAAESIVLTSYLPKEMKSVQTSILLRSEMKNELTQILISKKAKEADRMAQLFLTKLSHDTLPNGDEVTNIELPGDVLANIENVYILTHKDRIELNNEKGILFRSQQTVQNKKRLQEINSILENGYEIRSR